MARQLGSPVGEGSGLFSDHARERGQGSVHAEKHVLSSRRSLAGVAEFIGLDGAVVAC